MKAHCTSSCPSSYLPLWGGPTPRAASGWGHVLAGLVAWPSGNPPPQRRKSAAGPPRKGEVWSLLLRHDETCGSVAATQKRPGDARSEGCGAPSGRVLFLVGSLSAPCLRHRFRPFPRLPPVPHGERPADMDLSLPAQAERRSGSRWPVCSGREGLSPPVLGNGSHLSRLSSSAAAQPHMTETA